jgi:hypothetical protein
MEFSSRVLSRVAVRSYDVEVEEEEEVMDVLLSGVSVNTVCEIWKYG